MAPQARRVRGAAQVVVVGSDVINTAPQWALVQKKKPVASAVVITSVRAVSAA